MSQELVESGIGVLVLVSVGIGLELALRRLFGFGNPLLYVADDEIGYRLAPNQDVRRFGNRILINAYSMRGEAIAPSRAPDSLRVLILGDSIANGGWWTDQHQTISALLQQHISASSGTLMFSSVEVLNASANSWGPRNELAYLQTFGCFESQIVVLVINTDDLFATAPTSLPVGRDRNYPARKPPLAIAEVVGRYVLPATPIPELDAVRAEGGDRVGANLDAIGRIQAYVKQQGGQCMVVMTPLFRELGNPGSRDYERTARDRLVTFAQHQHLPYLDALPLLNGLDDPKQVYRDHIHFNAAGNQQIVEFIMAEWLERAIAELSYRRH